MISILLVDDQPRVRQGLRMRLALEPDLAVVGEAGNGQEAIQLAETLRPDVVVMDLEMPQVDGLAATAAVRAALPATQVVMLSIHDGPATRVQARAMGAADFVAKHEGANALIESIRRVTGRSN